MLTNDNQHGDNQFKPNTTVACVVSCDDKFLLVEEVEHGRQVFNQPAGHIEANENLVAAAQRELIEETGLDLAPDYLTGIYYFHRPELSLYFLRFCFVIELKQQLVCQPKDSDIIACHWLTLEQIKAKQKQLRSPMVLDCISDYLAGKKIPLSHLKSNL